MLGGQPDLKVTTGSNLGIREFHIPDHKVTQNLKKFKIHSIPSLMEGIIPISTEELSQLINDAPIFPVYD